jgi:UDP-N-acetylmuramate dehydrogenase
MNLDLRTYSTFKIGGIAHKVFEINDISDIEKINSYSKDVDKPFIIIGEGSNSIFADTTDKYILGLMNLKGITSQIESGTSVQVTAQGGESWDDLVAWAVDQNLSGIEALSGIPGTVGASPVQNIGAYGAELGDVFVSAYVFDREKNTYTTFTHRDCQFSYRDSIFKKNPRRYIIASITLRLHTTLPKIPEYKAVQDYFKNTEPILSQIRDAIISIRNAKIPNYKLFPNCGSFFKNPIIEKTHLDKILLTHPTIPYFETSENKIKLYTGWLIEHVDYASAQNKKVVFNEANKLILINKDTASYEDLQEVIHSITRLVRESFNITLEPEPNIFD